MEKKSDIKQDLELALFFDAAKQTEDIPNVDFLTSILADAQGQTDSRQNQKTATRPTPLFWAGFLNKLGGWQTVGALSACACAGLYVGYVAPENLTYISGTEISADITDDDGFLMAFDIETLFQEG